MRFLPPVINKHLIRDGVYFFIYLSPEKWGVFKALSTTYGDDTVWVDLDYISPGYHLHEELVFSDNSEWYVGAHGLRAIFNTEEEANQVAEQMLALMTIYQQEIGAPKLKLEMGVGILIANQGL